MTDHHATAGDGLREAIARLLCVHYAGVIDEELPIADEILALSGLRDVLADRDRLLADRGSLAATLDFLLVERDRIRDERDDVLAAAARDAEKVRRVEELRDALAETIAEAEAEAPGVRQIISPTVLLVWLNAALDPS